MPEFKVEMAMTSFGDGVILAKMVKKFDVEARRIIQMKKHLEVCAEDLPGRLGF